MRNVQAFLDAKAKRDEDERRAKAQAEGQASEIAQLQEAPVIGAAITSEGVSKAKSPIKESDEPPTPTEAPRAPEHTLSEALALGAKEASKTYKKEVDKKTNEIINGLGKPAIDQYGDARLVVTDDKGKRIPLKLLSSQCRSFLQDKVSEATGKALGKETLNSQIEALAGAALRGGNKIKVHTRTAHTKNDDGSFIHYLNLANGDGQMVEVSAQGWQTVKNTLVNFEAGLGELPLPIRSGSLIEAKAILFEELAKWGIKESDYLIIITILVEMFRDNTAYLVLEILGPAGAAKTTLASKIVSLIDPTPSGKLTEIPLEEEHIAAASHDSLIITIDNASKLPGDKQDLICRIVYGFDFVTRKLYENSEVVRQYIHNAVITTSILPIITRPDLAARAFRVYLKPRNAYKSALLLAAEQEAEISQVLGALLTLFSAGLRHLDTNKTSKHRMVDFALMGEAICTALEYPPDHFSGLLEASYKSTAEDFCEGDVFAQRFIEVCSEKIKHATKANAFLPFDRWKDNCCAIEHSNGQKAIGITSQALLDAMTNNPRSTLSFNDRNEFFPKNPRGLSSKLTLMAPLFKSLGYSVESKPIGRSKRQAWVILWK